MGKDKRRLRNAGRDVGGKADVSALSHVIWELTGEFSRDSEKNTPMLAGAAHFSGDRTMQDGKMPAARPSLDRFLFI